MVLGALALLLRLINDDNPNGVGTEENNAYGGSFKYSLVDSDGDISSEAEQKIVVTDTIATMKPISFTLDEDDLTGSGMGEAGSDMTGSLIGLRKIRVVEGKDPVEDIKFDSTDVANFISAYTSMGQALNYKLTDSDHTLLVYTGTSATDTTKHLFEAKIDYNATKPKKSTYSFELKGVFDHPGEHGQKAIKLNLPITLVEKDDIVKSVGVVSIKDDVPKAVAESDDIKNTKTVEEGSSTILSGNVMSNDTTGADGAKSI